MEMESLGNLTTTSSSPTGTTSQHGEGGSEELISPTDRIIIMVMLSVMSVVGIIGNALAIYVFANLKQKLTSTIFILTLAGTDFITCLITIPGTIAIEYLKYQITVDAACKIYHFLITTTVPFSCVIIVAIAVDRYMCICHPFHHWMNVKRARIIIGVLAVIIFIFGGIACMHYSIYKNIPANHTFILKTTTAQTPDYYSVNNFTSEVVVGGFTNQDPYYTSYPYSPRPSYSQEPMITAGVNETTIDILVTSSDSKKPTDQSSVNKTLTSGAAAGVVKPTPRQIDVCDIDPNFIAASFYHVFRKTYTLIFLFSCITVAILYALIYRSVISQRRKKLRIKSAQCCLLWNATSVETPHEEVEMTQDIELSHVNGEERFTTRHNSGTADELETHNNGAVRKCSLSKARIERMRVANIKTAFTLFIVTLVFIISFLPSWLMALEVIRMNVIVFYMYFIYNVANPFIYAFLNQNFKAELRRIFRCGKE